MTPAAGPAPRRVARAVDGDWAGRHAAPPRWLVSSVGEADLVRSGADPRDLGVRLSAHRRLEEAWTAFHGAMECGPDHVIVLLDARARPQGAVLARSDDGA